MSVTAYFDAVAEDYERRCRTGLLGRLRRAERVAVVAALEPRPGDTVLDAGCGAGFDAVPLMAARCEVVGVDLSPAMVAVARRRGVDARVADLGKLELGRTFSKILCCGALEFCAEPSRAIERLSRHLAPSGRLVLLVPIRSVVGLAYVAYHLRNGMRVRLFGVRDVCRDLERSGLRVTRVRRATPYTAVIEARAPA